VRGRILFNCATTYIVKLEGSIVDMDVAASKFIDRSINRFLAEFGIC
jgi:hypothetical protein